MVLDEIHAGDIVYTPNLRKNVVQIDIVDKETGSWKMLTVPFDDLLTYLYDLDEMYWGVESHVKIGVLLSRITRIEYAKTLYAFIRGYLQTPKENDSSRQVVPVFDLPAGEINPLWN